MAMSMARALPLRRMRPKTRSSISTASVPSVSTKLKMSCAWKMSKSIIFIWALNLESSSFSEKSFRETVPLPSRSGSKIAINCMTVDASLSRLF
eukprot:UN3466